MIKWFEDISLEDIITCGGKGSSLGEMKKVGFPVPNGFVLTTEAFGKKSNDWEAEVLQAFDLLDCTFVAVRSSGTKEDGLEDSFAGQFDTYLFVTRENLVKQIITCHNSINSNRIKSYCESKKINRNEIKVAVVIQKMINSDVAGVCFTANPVSGSAEEIMIEAGYGIGEAVVSGMITPDNYIVDKASLYIQKNISTQTKKIVLDIGQGGTIEEDVELKISSVQKLSDKHILELSKYAKKMEEHYGKPMDVEWAVESGKLYLLQARPITTKVKKYTQLEKDLNTFSGFKYHFFHTRFRSPLYTFLLREGLRKHYNTDVSFKYEAQYFIYHCNDLAVPKDIWEGLSIKIKKELNRDPQLLPKLLNGAIEHQNNIEKTIYELNIFFKEKNEISIPLLEKFFTQTYEFGAYNILPLLVEKEYESILLNIIKSNFPDYDSEKIFQIITTPQKNSTIQEKEIDLLEILEENNTDKREKKIIQHIEKFSWIKDNSYIGSCSNISDIKEELAQMKNSKKNSIQVKENQQLQKELFLQYYNILNDKEKEIVDDLLNSILLRSWRTERFYYNGYLLKNIYKYMTELFNLNNLNEIFFLTPVEIIDYLKGKKKNYQKRIDERKKSYVALSDNSSTRIYSGESAISKRKVMVNVHGNIDNHNVLKGNISYPGDFKGYVVIVLDKSEYGKIKEGCVLVANSTTPDIVPYLKLVKGIITDEGGVTCHASIISRELMIPCVIGTKIGTQILKDGELIVIKNGVIIRK